jgi:UDP-4-amino-4-deoxy-L-arabinose formyltransferase/UDP-glucuronic acid dehydrogenase (UDP-4-keto-hexauronic acid decarboxylating)
VRILLVAEEAAGIQVLRRIADSSHQLVAVLTQPPTRGGGATVASVAEGLGVTVQPSERVREPELGEWIRDEEVDLLLNVHSLFVANEEVVRAPKIGSFNLHPGPLPEYAGLNAPSWAVYHGERRHVVTVHWMDPEIDTGPIAYEQAFDITDADTGLSVSTKCVRGGLPLVSRLLEDAAGNGALIPAIEQDIARRRYFGREVPQGGKIVWSRPARQVVDFVRACDYLPFPSPWGEPVARLGEQEVAILRASRTGEPVGEPPGTIGRVEGGDALVATADEWIRVHRIRVGGIVVDAGAAVEPGRLFEDGR